MKNHNPYIISAAIVFMCCGYALRLNASDTLRIDAKCLYNIANLKTHDPWFETENPAGLRLNKYENISLAEGFFEKDNGGFIRSYQSDNSYAFGLRTESFMRVENTHFYGRAEYRNFTGENMSMGGVIYPERYPLYVGDSQPGVKRLETYKLSGGMGMPITQGLDWGFGINYEAANMAKRKDLRHKNNLMDMELMPGLMYGRGHVRLGLNYYYRKFHDKPSFSRIGDDAVNSKGYLFKGLGFGLYEMWTTPGMNLSRSFTDVVNGLAAQVELNYGRIQFLNEFSYRRRKGLTGEGEERAYSKALHNNYSYKGFLTITSSSVVHFVRLRTDYEDLTNYDRITNQEIVGGITTTINYGNNKIFNRCSFTANGEYELLLGRWKHAPEWSAKIGVDYYRHVAVSSLLTPIYYTQRLDNTKLYVAATHMISFKRGMIDVGLGASYMSGGGNKLDKHIVPSINEVVVENTYPALIDVVLDTDFEILTAQRLSAQLKFRYAYFVNKTKGNSLYLDMFMSYTKASKIIYLKDDYRLEATCAIGYSF